MMIAAYVSAAIATCPPVNPLLGRAFSDAATLPLAEEHHAGASPSDESTDYHDHASMMTAKRAEAAAPDALSRSRNTIKAPCKCGCGVGIKLVKRAAPALGAMLVSESDLPAASPYAAPRLDSYRASHEDAPSLPSEPVPILA